MQISRFLRQSTKYVVSALLDDRISYLAVSDISYVYIFLELFKLLQEIITE